MIKIMTLYVVLKVMKLVAKEPKVLSNQAQVAFSIKFPSIEIIYSDTKVVSSLVSR